jgi:hypothetical protein
MASMVEIGKIESTTHTGSAKSFWILDFGFWIEGERVSGEFVARRFCVPRVISWLSSDLT